MPSNDTLRIVAPNRTMASLLAAYDRGWGRWGQDPSPYGYDALRETAYELTRRGCRDVQNGAGHR